MRERLREIREERGANVASTGILYMGTTKQNKVNKNTTKKTKKKKSVSLGGIYDALD